jgi:hypothetical protein
MSRRSPRRPVPSRPAGRFRPGCEPLELRDTPATATLTAGVLTIDFTSTGTTAESVTVSSDGTNITLTGNATGATSNPVANVTAITVTDSGGGTNQAIMFGGAKAITLSGGLSSTDVESIGIGTAVAVTGTGEISLHAPGAVGAAAVGITVDGAALSTAAGDITLSAKGGENGGANAGVAVINGGSITAGGAGAVTIHGTGGTLGTSTDPDSNYGVFVSDPGSRITSSGGAVSVTGHGTLGVVVGAGGEISAGGNGAVTVDGTGGATAPGQNWGVFVSGAGAVITSAGGPVSVTGTGGGMAAGQGNNVGVGVTSGGQVTAGGNGSVTVVGTGGVAGGGGVGTGNNYGVYVDGSAAPAAITSSGGDVTVTGQGGGLTDGAGSNVGVLISSNAQVAAAGTGNVTVSGTGGAAGGVPGNGGNIGVTVQQVGARIGSAGGNVSVTGTGGGIASGQGDNYGIWLNLGGQVGAGGAGSATVLATGGADGGGRNLGLVVQQIGSKISTAGGDISVTARGGGTPGGKGSNAGMQLNDQGQVSAGGTGTVSVAATGGTAGGDLNHGLVVSGAGSAISSAGGDVTVVGTRGGDGVAVNNIGTVLELGGTISAAGVGKLNVSGQATLFAVGGSDGTVRLVNSVTQAAVGQTFRPLDVGGVPYNGVVEVALGDINGDSVPDLFAAAASPVGEFGLDPGKAGKVFVYDGVTLARSLAPAAPLHTFTPFPTAEGPAGNTLPYTNGLNIAAADVDGDGKVDLIAGTRGGSATAGTAEYGRLTVLGVGAADDGSADTRLGSIVKPFGNGYQKGVVVTGGDLDGDGRAEVAVTRGGPVVQSNPNKTVKLKAFKFDGANLVELNLSGQTDGAGNTVALAPFGNVVGANGEVIERDARVAIVDQNGDGKGTLVFTTLDRVTDPANIRLRVAAYTVDTTSGLGTLVSTGTGSTPTSYLIEGRLSDHAITHADSNGDGRSDLALIVESSPSGILFLDPITGAFLPGGFGLTVATGGVTIDGS